MLVTIGSTLNDRYRIEQLLGEGGMSQVFLATDLLSTDGPKQVALKLLAVSTEKEPQILRGFKREFETLGSLAHAGLAKVFDFGTHRETGRSFFTTEWIEGADLFAATRKYTLQEKIKVMIHLCDALDYLHAKRILHNDIKTGNILLTPGTVTPKFVDFGLSLFGAVVPDLNTLAFVRGTPRYLAPEIIRGENPSVASDLFALGVTFYRILADRYPHDGEDTGEILQNNLAGRFLPLDPEASEIPADVSCILMALLSLDPGDRPRSAAALSAQLRTATQTPAIESAHASELAFLDKVEWVGRAAALQTLKSFIASRIPSPWSDGAAPDPSPFALVHGELGMGKTSLLLSLKSQCQLAGIPFLFFTGDSENSAFATILPENSPILREEDPVSFLTHLVDELRRAFREKPFVLAVDEIERLDEMSRALLVHLIRGESGEGPPLVLAATREDALLKEIAPGTSPLFISLPALSETETTLLMARALPGSKVSSRMIGQIHRASGGNPHFILEYLRELMRSGALLRREGQWVWQDSSGPRHAKTLEELLTQKVLARSGVERALLAMLAIAAEKLSQSDFQTLGKLTPEIYGDQKISGVDQALGKLAAAGLLRLEKQEFGFSQGALSEVVLKTLSVQVQNGIHSSLIELLRRKRPQPAARLARHYGALGQRAETVRYALLAATERRERFALQEAQGFYRLASQQAVDVPELSEQLLQGVVGLAEIAWRMGCAEDAARQYEEVLRLTAKEPEHKERPQAHRVLGIIERNRGEFGRAQEIFAAALNELDREATPERAMLTAQLALVHHRLDDGARALTNGEAALTLIGKQRKKNAEALGVLFSLSAIYKERGQFDRARQINQEALTAAEVAGNRRHTAIALNNLAALAATVGENEKALSYLERALEISRQIRDAIRIAYGLSTLGKLEFLAGRYRRAAAHLDEAVNLAERIGNFNLAAGVCEVLARLEKERCRFTTAKEYAARAGVLVGQTAQLNGEAPPEALDWASSTRTALAEISKRLEKTRQKRGNLEPLERRIGALVEDLRDREVPLLLSQALALQSVCLEDREHRAAAAEALGEAVRLQKGIGEIFLDQAQCKEMQMRYEKLSMPEARQNQALKRLLEINRQLAAGWSSRERLLEYILDMALELTGASRAFIMRGEPGKLVVEAARLKKHPGIADEWKSSYSTTIVQEVLASGRSVTLVDAQGGSPYQSQVSIIRLQLRSVACVPLMTAGQTIGVLYVDEDRHLGHFQEAHLEILAALADQGMVALKLFDERREMIKSLDDTTAELRRARALADEQSRQLEWRYAYGRIAGGEAPAMKKVFSALDRIIPTQSPIVICGESGTGKELIAQTIHYNGPRAKGPFLSINCAALTQTLLESELFGHVKGAFTGAESDRDGLLVLAHSGTIFLDEIGEMPLEAQAKLLRVVQEKEVRPLGGAKTLYADVRFVAATQKSLRELVAQGLFREDLYYRLNVMEVDLPALRERPEDLALLVDSFLIRESKRQSRTRPNFSIEAFQALQRYSWPGNVRELKNLIERLLVMYKGKKIGVAELPEEIRSPCTKAAPDIGKNLDAAREEFVKTYLQEITASTKGNISEAARQAGVHRRSFYRLLKRYGVEELAG